jgi:N-acetylglucosamine-6-phosphate deacetylase
MDLMGRRYDTGQPICVELHDGLITAVRTCRVQERSGLPWIAPGLVDLQINGHGGRDFINPNLTPEDVESISLGLDRDGVIGFLPTATTQSRDRLKHALATIAAAIEQSPAVRQRAWGIHLEGPYISAEEGPRGAHPVEHCRPPNWDEFQQFQAAAQGQIRIVTMSPEYDEAPDFVRRVAESGVIVAIGHTAANSDQIQAAVDAGATLSTHLGNGTHSQLPRHPNYVWDQMAEDRLTASIVADGHHLPPSVLKSITRAKTPERLVLVSDITGLAGSNRPPGRYEDSALGAIELLEDGRAVIADQRDYLAGATLPLTVGITNMVQLAQLDLSTALELASANPARMLQRLDHGLEEGRAADLIQFEFPDSEDQMTISATIKAGKVVYGEPVLAGS